MEDLRPNDQRAKNAITIIWIILIFEILLLISGYFQYELLQSIAKGNEIPMDRINANDRREQIFNTLFFITLIVSFVTFIKWFRRAYYNLHLRVKHLSFKEGWAAGSWFVPIISLFRPYQIMKELYLETKELLTEKGISFNQGFNTKALGLWWTLWIISNIIGQFEFRYSMNAYTIEELSILTVASMINNIIGIPLALLAIKVIRNYANVEPLLREVNDKE